MVTTQPDPAAAAPNQNALTQNDREVLSWYLARGLTPEKLKQPDLATPELRDWARSPKIAPHIEAFHEINAEAELTRHTRAKIDGYAAVSDALQRAETATEKLHAIHALIRLNTSFGRPPRCATGSPRREATSATRSTSSPSTPRPHNPFPLPPLPMLAVDPATGRLMLASDFQKQQASGGGAAAQSGASHGAASPLATAASANGSPAAHATASTSPALQSHQTSASHPSHKPALQPTPSTAPTQDQRRGTQDPGLRTKDSSSAPTSTLQPSRSRLDSPARRLMETSGAAPAGAWT